MKIHDYSVLVIGGGGGGLYAALESSKTVKTAVISKLYPHRSHTGAAQGGMAASLGNMEDDKIDWHVYDTIKGGDYLVDQNTAQILAEDAIEIVPELERLGLPFSRTAEGKIAQRKFGGHTSEFGKGPVRRTCYSADRAGHMILHTLYQQCIKNDVQFYNEFHVVDVIMHGTKCTGVVAYELSTHELHIFNAQSVIFATGGFARMFKVTSNAYANTGDGPAVLARAGIPMMDMEFFQFHPTGLYPTGILVTEGARGEGGILKNRDGEEFMAKYSPTLKNLAPRDVVSRSIVQELLAGKGLRGDGRPDDYVHLDLTHLGKDLLESKLPDISEFCRTYAGIEASEQAIPIQPTAHYSMGGIPSSASGQVNLGAGKTVYEGLYAVGECACLSVHGANRLGSNSLLEIVVFGRRAGREAALHAKGADVFTNKKSDADEFRSFLSGLKANGKKSPKLKDLYSRMQETMMVNCGVYRNEKGIQTAISDIKALREEFKEVKLGDPSTNTNTDLINIFELRNLLDLAYLTTASADNRKESRGGHSREDFKERDDKNFLKHTLAKLNKDNSIGIDYREVVIYWDKYPPKARTF